MASVFTLLGFRLSHSTSMEIWLELSLPCPSAIRGRDFTNLAGELLLLIATSTGAVWLRWIADGKAVWKMRTQIRRRRRGKLCTPGWKGHVVLHRSGEVVGHSLQDERESVG